MRSDLPLESLKKAYSRRRLIVIPDFLKADVAQEVYESLLSLDSKLWYHCDNRRTDAGYSQHRFLRYPLKNLKLHRSYSDRRKLAKSSPDKELGRNHPLVSIGDWMNSVSMHAWMSRLIGQPLSPGKLLCFASLFRQGDFNGMHNDGSFPRRAAFVLYLTKNWKKSWGGNLVFADGKTLAPSFNSLVVFDVPVDHRVSKVSQNAKEPRFAVAGWYHDYSDKNFKKYVRQTKQSGDPLW